MYALASTDGLKYIYILTLKQNHYSDRRHFFKHFKPNEKCRKKYTKRHWPRQEIIYIFEKSPFSLICNALKNEIKQSDKWRDSKHLLVIKITFFQLFFTTLWEN